MSKSENIARERWKELFRVQDSDGSGKVSRATALAVLQSTLRKLDLLQTAGLDEATLEMLLDAAPCRASDGFIQYDALMDWLLGTTKAGEDAKPSRQPVGAPPHRTHHLPQRRDGSKSQVSTGNHNGIKVHSFAAALLSPETEDIVKRRAASSGEEWASGPPSQSQKQAEAVDSEGRNTKLLQFAEDLFCKVKSPPTISDRQAVKQALQDNDGSTENMIDKATLVESLRSICLEAKDVASILEAMGGPDPSRIKCADFIDAAFAHYVKIGNNTVMVTAEHEGIDVQKAITSIPFKNWVEALEKDEKIIINKIQVQSVDMFGQRVGFIKFKTEAVVNGKAAPGIVFMRGGAVAILVVLKYDGKNYTVGVRQPRIAAGDHAMLEVPAGMLDGDGNFMGVAAKEMKEETGIAINTDDLIDLSKLAYGSEIPGMFPSCGACDEFNRLFLYRKHVTKEELDDMQGRLTGVLEEGEHITLEILPLDEFWKRSRDAKVLGCLCLMDRLIAEGTLDVF